jgi:hypothetical protein
MKSTLYTKSAGLLGLGCLFLLNCTPKADSGGDSSNTGGNASTGKGGSTPATLPSGGSTGNASGGNSGTASGGGSGSGSGGSASGGSPGGSGGGSGGSTSPGSGGSTGTPDANVGPTPDAPASLAAVVGKLDKTLFKIVITKYDGDGRSGCGVVEAQKNQTNEDTLKNDASKTYDVTFRVRGLVEPRMYNAGTPDPASPFINVGGTPNNGGAENQGQYAIFKIDVAEPKQSYYLNAFHGDHKDHQVYPMDYRLKVKAKGGSKISVLLVDSNACAIANKMNKIVEGLPADVLMQPFKDQFLYVEAESVVAAP